MKELGTKITESKELGDNVVITRTLADDQVTMPKVLEYHDNVSCISGGVETSVFLVSHNLNVSPRIYGATVLSHASGRFNQAQVGAMNQSQMAIVIQATVSGHLAASGLFVHAFAMA